MHQLVLCLRPEPGLSQTVLLGKAHGLNITGFALSLIEPIDWTAPKAVNYDGILAGSANVFRHGGAGLESLTRLPVLAVGAATKQAAEEKGFTVSFTGRGGLQSVLDSAPADTRRFLRLCGSDRVALARSGNQIVDEIPVYRSQKQPLDPIAPTLSTSGTIVLLHSAETARHFARECNRLGVDRRNITLAALGPRIVENVGAGWGDIAVAETPEDPTLLAMARNICQ